MSTLSTQRIRRLGLFASLGLVVVLAVEANRTPDDWNGTGAPAAKTIATEPIHGRTMFAAKGCRSCHRMDESGGIMGPDLSHVGARLPYETIERILAEPRSVNPYAVMPAPALLPPERVELARFLAGLS
jgi:cbb3-type cytochrome oxidase cytochrome c subunit